MSDKPDFSNFKVGGTPKTDFSNVKTGGGEKTDFSNVKSGGSSTATKIYEVVSGDSLSKIAKREYGDANAWRAIFEANTDIIKDPDKIFPGQKLKIPPK